MTQPPPPPPYAQYPPSPYWPPAPQPPRRGLSPLLVVGLVVAALMLGAGVTVGVLALRGSSTPTAAIPAPATTTGVAPPVASSTPTASPSEPPFTVPPGKTYTQALILVGDLGAAGLPCGDPTPVDNPTYAKTLIDCGPEITVSTYASHAEAVAAFHRLVSMTAGSGSTITAAVGANWMVNGPPDYVRQVAAAFHAQYMS